MPSRRVCGWGRYIGGAQDSGVMWFVGTVPFGTMRRVGGEGVAGPVEG